MTEEPLVATKEKNKNRPSRHRNSRSKGPVCVLKDGIVQRVARFVAAKLTQEGWSYCPKKTWRATKNKELAKVPLPKRKKATK